MQNKQPLQRKGFRWGILQILAVLVCILLVFAISVPNLLRSRIAADQAVRHGKVRQHMAAINAAGGAFKPDYLESSTKDEREVTRSAAMDLIVDDPRRAASAIQDLLHPVGGYMASSETTVRTEGAHIALVVRIPESSLDGTLEQIRKLAFQVRNERVEANDVTTQHADLASSLRNQRSEEQRYIAIMSKAKNVKDTLEVAKQLSDVQGRIDHLQTQIDLINKQIELATISLNIDSREEAATVHWYPWHHAKNAAAQAAQDLADYADVMIAFAFKLPGLFVWGLTVVMALSTAFRLLVIVWQRWLKKWMIPAHTVLEVATAEVPK